jgi:hypothetical protein
MPRVLGCRTSSNEGSEVKVDEAKAFSENPFIFDFNLFPTSIELVRRMRNARNQSTIFVTSR